MAGGGHRQRAPALTYKEIRQTRGCRAQRPDPAATTQETFSGPAEPRRVRLLGSHHPSEDRPPRALHLSAAGGSRKRTASRLVILFCENLDRELVRFPHQLAPQLVRKTHQLRFPRAAAWVRPPLAPQLVRKTHQLRFPAQPRGFVHPWGNFVHVPPSL